MAVRALSEQRVFVMAVTDLQLSKISAAASAAGENRFAPRRKGQTAALIYLEGAVESVLCLITDMSTTGAKLQLRNGWDNPFKSNVSHMDRIKLVVRLDKVMYDCKIVRRGETELGVKFTSMPKPLAKIVR